MNDTTLQEAVGGALRNVRMEKKLTLRKVQEKCFVSIAHLSDIERGVKNASFELLEVIYTLGYGLTTKEFLNQMYHYTQGKRVGDVN